jgi:ABC-type multidrug transport system fused ATPase/permease subunit
MRYLLIKLYGELNSRRRFQILFLVIISLVCSLSEIVTISLLIPLINILISKNYLLTDNNQEISFYLNFAVQHFGDSLLFIITITFILFTLASGFLRLVLLYYQTNLGHKIGIDISEKIYYRALMQSYEIHISRNSSEIISAISLKANRVVNEVILPALSIISGTILLTIILSSLVYINTLVALLSILFFSFCYLLISVFTRRTLKSSSHTIAKMSTRVIKTLQDGLGGIRDILISKTQNYYINLYRAADIPLRKAQSNIQIISSSPRFIIEAVGMSFIALMSFVLVDNDNESNIIPIMGAIAFGAQRLLPVMQQIYSGISSIRGNKHSLKDVIEMIHMPIIEQYQLSPSTKISFNNVISLRNLSFQHYNTRSNIFSKINLNIYKGNIVGIIGSTGSGKSTFIDLLMGLLHPTSGCICIDNIELTKRNISCWQSLIAHVPQNIFISDDSVLQNIAFGIEIDKINIDDVKRAALLAHIHNDIELLSDGYLTQLGERGTRLSGGQIQRIGIARAIYRKCEVLILDEATSALDNDTEHLVMKSITSLSTKLTIIIIAHRLTTLRDCDQIIQIENGQINLIDSYDSLSVDSNTKCNTV